MIIRCQHCAQSVVIDDDRRPVPLIVPCPKCGKSNAIRASSRIDRRVPRRRVVEIPLPTPRFEKD